MDQITDSTPNSDVKSFKPYTGKTPLLLQITSGLMLLGGLVIIYGDIELFEYAIAALMWFESVEKILREPLLLLIIGLGIVPIILGVLNIKYAKAVFKMQRKGFKRTLILQGIVIVVSIIRWGAYSFTRFNKGAFVEILYALVVSSVLYLYRDRFINE